MGHCPMKMLARMVVVGLGIAAVVGVTLVVLSDPEFGGPADGPRGGVPWLFGGSSGSSRSGAESAGSGRDPGDPPLPLFSAGYIDDSGYDFALDFTPPIADRSSL